MIPQDVVAQVKVDRGHHCMPAQRQVKFNLKVTPVPTTSSFPVVIDKQLYSPVALFRSEHLHVGNSVYMFPRLLKLNIFVCEANSSIPGLMAFGP